MKAIAYAKPAPIEAADSLIELDVPAPAAPQGRELLVEIRAVSVNPVDAKQRRGVDPGATPRILGFDGAGVVRAVGPEAELFRPGDEVFYAGVVNRPGTNAELHLVDERIVGPKPKTLSFAEAASLPLTSITAWEALFDRLQVPQGIPQPKRGVLILGGGGGVASIAIQLARQLTGTTVLASAGRGETQAWCTLLGAHHVLDHGGDIAAQAKALGLSIPYVFGINRTEAHWPAICSLLAPFGLVCVIDQTGPLDLAKLRPKSGGLVFEGTWLGEGEVSVAGPNALARAKATADVLLRRLEMRGLPVRARIDLIGIASVHDSDDGALWRAYRGPAPPELRIRLAAEGADRDAVDQAAREVLALLCCGTAGTGGARWRLTPRILTRSYLVLRERVPTRFVVQTAHALAG